MNKLHTITMSIEDYLNKDPYNIPKEYIVGFFITQKHSRFLITLYLISQLDNEYDNIDYFDIYRAYQLFLVTTHNVFCNPPLKYWLDSKQEWCYKLAKYISNKFKVSMEDAMSDIQFSIVKCYNKKNIYLGSLEYLKKTAINMQLTKYRKSKYEKNILSLSTPIDDEGELEIEDVIGIEDENFSKLEFKDIEKKAIELLKPKFSDREIDQILKLDPTLLPSNVLQRLYMWRNKHKKDELYDDTRTTDNGPSK